MKTKTLALALIALLATMLAPAQAQAQARNVTLTIKAGSPPGGPCSMGRFYIDSDTNAIYFCNRVGLWSTFAADLDLSGYATQSYVATNFFPKANSGITLGSSTVNDRIIITPIAKGAAAFTGTITSADLTAARTWTLPNDDGTLATTTTLSTYVLKTCADCGDFSWHMTGSGDFDLEAGSGDMGLWLDNNSLGMWNDGKATFEIDGGTDDAIYMTNGNQAPFGFAAINTGSTNSYWNEGTSLGRDVTIRNMKVNVGPGIAEASGGHRGLRGGRQAFSPGSYYNVSYAATVPDYGTTCTAQKVKITVVDTTPSIIAGKVQMCGYAACGDPATDTLVCETLDFAGGAAAQETTATFVWVEGISVSGFSVLGGAGDETIAGEWHDATPIFTAANLVAASDPSAITWGVYANKTFLNTYFLNCVDLNGCDISLVGDACLDGREVQFVVLSGSKNWTVKESAGFELSAGTLTLGPYDALHLVCDAQDTKWVETAYSNN